MEFRLHFEVAGLAFCQKFARIFRIMSYIPGLIEMMA